MGNSEDAFTEAYGFIVNASNVTVCVKVLDLLINLADHLVDNLLLFFCINFFLNSTQLLLQPLLDLKPELLLLSHFFLLLFEKFLLPFFLLLLFLFVPCVFLLLEFFFQPFYFFQILLPLQLCPDFFLFFHLLRVLNYAFKLFFRFERVPFISQQFFFLVLV